jgi:hypothetical protein
VTMVGCHCQKLELAWVACTYLLLQPIKIFILVNKFVAKNFFGSFSLLFATTFHLVTAGNDSILLVNNSYSV